MTSEGQINPAGPGTGANSENNTGPTRRVDVPPPVSQVTLSYCKYFRTVINLESIMSPTQCSPAKWSFGNSTAVL